MGAIKRTRFSKGKIPPVSPPDESQYIRFSFTHLDLKGNPKFCTTHCQEGYLDKFLDRLGSLSKMTVLEFRTNRSPSLKSHRIDWEQTSEKKGFSHLNEQLRDEQPWQFEITRNKHGRVHGLILGNTFYVVWVDPTHQLYSS